MRSGLTHLKRRPTTPTEEPYSDGSSDKPALTLGIRDDGPKPVLGACDLDDAIWSVVCFDGIEAGGMTYAQAARLMAELDSHGVTGLCIVTDAAATNQVG